MKTTVTKPGEITAPAELGREMHLEPGQTILWEKLSEHEGRFTVLPKQFAAPGKADQPDQLGALSFAKRHGLEEGTTAEWMKLIRGDEED